MVKMDTMGPPEGTEETVKMAKMVLRSSIIFDKKWARKPSLSYFPTCLIFCVAFHFCLYSRKSNLLRVSLKTPSLAGTGGILSNGSKFVDRSGFLLFASGDALAFFLIRFFRTSGQLFFFVYMPCFLSFAEFVNLFIR